MGSTVQQRSKEREQSGKWKGDEQEQFYKMGLYQGWGAGGCLLQGLGRVAGCTIQPEGLGQAAQE
jgi:hypothetical protein